MRQKILSGIAMFVAFVALAVSLGAYVYSSKYGLPNEKAYCIQLIGVGFIVLICVVNFVSALKSQPETEESEESQEQSEPEQEIKPQEKKEVIKKAQKPVKKLTGNSAHHYAKKSPKKSANKRRKKRK